ncbi:MAG: membrane protein insertase YidC [Chloroflexi bacterium]|nr:membrane protein insertase YidC [Chloroflexota bacterium]
MGPLIDSLGLVWNVGVVQPLADALIFLTNFFGSYGLAIIVFTVAVKIVLLPLTIKQLQSSKAMMAIQPQLQALQKKYGKDREKLMQEQMRIYKENKVNPAAGCLPLVVQMPIWFGLYQALIMLSGQEKFAASGFLWLSSLAQPEGPPWILAIATGATQWVVSRMMTPRSTDPQQKMMNQMMQFMPIMMVIFAFSVPSGLVLYWVASNVFTFVQQYFATGWGSLLPEKQAIVVEARVSKGQPGVAAAERAVGKGSAPQIEAPARDAEEAIARVRSQGSKKKKGRKR